MFALGTGFGVADPGSATGYQRLRPASCWGSTVGTHRYNTYFEGRCGPEDESMYRYIRGAYRQGMVIEYNTRLIRQGHGSAIFLHVARPNWEPTEGCVALQAWDVLELIGKAEPGSAVSIVDVKPHPFLDAMEHMDEARKPPRPTLNVLTPRSK